MKEYVVWCRLGNSEEIVRIVVEDSVIIDPCNEARKQIEEKYPRMKDNPYASIGTTLLMINKLVDID